MMKTKTELLAPAGNLEKLKIAILYGADAVYLGGKRFGLRSYGGNFSFKDMQTGVEFAHARGRKVYVTVNIFAHNDDLIGLPEYLRQLDNLKVDGILVSDLGVFSVVRQTVPNIPVHISTQANTTNWAAVRAWTDIGAARVVLARELSRHEIKKIRDNCSVELEMFVHGAMCISYSGRCVMSNYMTGRDSNRGACAQACRWKYSLMEEKRPGEYFPIKEDAQGTYIFNSKDLCLLPYIGEIIENGVNSLKIEGRMKSIYYVAGVIKVYREAIDAYYNGVDNWAELLVKWQIDLAKISHRQYTSGFFLGKPDEEGQVYNSSKCTQTADFVGLVREYDAATGYAVIEQRNNIKVGQKVEIFQPTKASYYQVIEDMQDECGNKITAAPHPQQLIKMKLENPVERYAMLRRDVR